MYVSLVTSSRSESWLVATSSHVGTRRMIVCNQQDEKGGPLPGIHFCAGEITLLMSHDGA